MSRYPITPSGHLLVQFQLPAAWTTVTDDVFGPRAGGITIQRGLASEQAHVGQSSAQIMIRNTAGEWSPGNPVGPNYGSLYENTVVRILVDEVVDAMSQLQNAPSLPTPSVITYFPGLALYYFHAAYVSPGTTNITLPGTVTASGVERDGTFGTSAGAYSAMAAPGTVTVKTASITATADYGFTAVIVLPNATSGMIAEALSSAGATSTPTDPPRTLTTGAGTAVGDWLVAISTYDAFSDDPTLEDPTGWVLIDEQANSGSLGKMRAWIKAVSVAGANTVEFTSPSFGSIDHHVRLWRLSGWGGGFPTRRGGRRWVGEIPSWLPTWDKTGTDSFVPLNALGLFGRLGTGAKQLRSAIRREAEKSQNLVAYLPMEDESGATLFASGLAGGRPGRPTGAVSPASDATSFPGSEPLPVLAAGGEVHLNIPAFSFTTTTSYRMLIAVPEAGFADQSVILDTFTNGTTRRIAVRYLTGGGLSVSAYDRGDVLLDTDSHGFDVDGFAHMLALDIIQVGSDITYNIYTRTLVASGDIVTGGSGGTFTGLTWTAPYLAVVGNGGNLVDAAVGHLMVGTNTSLGANLIACLNGYAGERAAARLARLCTEEGLTFELVGETADTALMGPQRAATLMELFEDCANADRGMLYESRWQLAVAYRTRTSLYNQRGTGLTLDYDASHLSEVPAPGDPTLLRRNRIVAGRRGGIQGVIKEQTTGNLSVSRIGQYELPIDDLNLHRDDQVEQIAGFELALGVVESARYPRVAIEYSRQPFIASAQLTAVAAALDLGDHLFVDNMPDALGAYEDPEALVLGSDEQLENLQWRQQWNTRPAGPYNQVAVADDDGSRLDTSGSVLVSSISSSATALTGALSTGSAGRPAPRWTVVDAEFPFGILMAGEEMTVTDITPPATYTYTLGTVAHASNASVSPGAPSGSGGLLVMLAAIRNSGTGTPNTPTGWTLVPCEPVSNFRMFLRVADGTATDTPTVTFANGVANADTSAQILRVTGAQINSATRAIRGYANCLNASAQDIAIPGLVMREGYNLIIAAGWKQDDWTSVAPPAGFTEIDEPDTTTGDDQGFTWARVQQGATPAAIAASSFVVTGGASAISRAMIVAIGDDKQAFTVTRSVNGVVKSQTAGAAFSLARPVVPGL